MLYLQSESGLTRALQDVRSDGSPFCILVEQTNVTLSSCTVIIFSESLKSKSQLPQAVFHLNHFKCSTVTTIKYTEQENYSKIHLIWWWAFLVNLNWHHLCLWLHKKYINNQFWKYTAKTIQQCQKLQNKKSTNCKNKQKRSKNGKSISVLSNNADIAKYCNSKNVKNFVGHDTKI